MVLGNFTTFPSPETRDETACYLFFFISYFYSQSKFKSLKMFKLCEFSNFCLNFLNVSHHGKFNTSKLQYVFIISDFVMTPLLCFLFFLTGGSGGSEL